jgi:hypothetical protein
MEDAQDVQTRGAAPVDDQVAANGEEPELGVAGEITPLMAELGVLLQATHRTLDRREGLFGNTRISVREELGQLQEVAARR